MANASQHFLAYARCKSADRVYDFHVLKSAARDNFGLYLGEVSPAMRGAITASPMTFGALADRLEQALAEQVSA